ncbi:unnamed protein product [Psylliodes chrysocephalus]|uniref:Uncharacterized protein n=1 Tax=Psylliodes chrysocephalus TaxID=3402493 RepID=A0A9P0CQZ6_9CUCU|nr:unnamed protein product [Psylliodes chrysocephala]
MEILDVSLLCLATLPVAHTIMVSFGTNQGPIVPRQPKSTSAQERTIVARSPAPVSEYRDDVPNPNVYKPPYPHQYRTKLYAYKPSANLILGTPLDQKFTPNSIPKYHYYKKQLQRLNLGADYTGPNIFERQEYEFLPKTVLIPSVKYNKPIYAPAESQNSKYVPEIGVAYSSGIRYYVPQIIVVNPHQNDVNPRDENSVYDVEDQKYYQ